MSPSLPQSFWSVVLFTYWLLALNVCGQSPPAVNQEHVIAQIHQGVDRLNERYWSKTLSIWLDRAGDDLRAHFEGRLNPPWWPSANAVEMLIDYSQETGDSQYLPAVETLYRLQRDHVARRTRLVAELKRRNQWGDGDERRWQRELQSVSENLEPRSGYYSDFQNEYPDDSGWWGITWLKMADQTGAAKYLATAETIHAHMAKNWRPEKGGGVLWCEDEDKQRPNAITNNLFLILSARLYQRTGDTKYLRWAEQTLSWLQANSLFDGTGVVDAPGNKGDYWSYNQGTYVGGLAALYLATGREVYLEEAAKVARSVIQKSGLVLPSGVLVEKLGTSGDASLFKGVLVRYFAELAAILRGQNRYAETANSIEQCIRASVESMLQHGVAGDGFFRPDWHESTKGSPPNFDSQVSALIALVAVLPQTQQPASAPATDKATH